jgi:hypothetical protein
MNLTIQVSTNYNNTKLLTIIEKNDMTINEFILNNGLFLYNNLEYYSNDLLNDKLKEKYDNKELEYENKIKLLEKCIENLKNEKTFEISSFIEKGKELTKQEYDKIIELQKIMNEELKSKNNKLENNIQELNGKLIQFTKHNENTNYETINGNILNLNDKFSNYFDKFLRGNTEKGNFGEDYIETYLVDKFSNSHIIDTHKETAKGDFLFSFDKCKMLIESKNVQILKKDDIDKFYRDIDLRISKNEINSALLISLNDTNLIHGKRHFYFEIRNNIPIIMISNVFQNNEFIRFSIILLNYLLKNGFGIKNETETNDEKITFFTNTLQEIFLLFKSQLSYLQNDKQLILKLEESFRKREADLFNMEKIFINCSTILHISMDNSNNQTQNNNDLEKVLNTMIEKIQQKIDIDPSFIINSKNLETLQISNHQIRKIGGIRKIIDTIKNNKSIVL